MLIFGQPILFPKGRIQGPVGTADLVAIAVEIRSLECRSKSPFQTRTVNGDELLDRMLRREVSVLVFLKQIRKQNT